ncbi:hypothetical protein J6590_037882 [Homalodisca vitripennis]|nr:hypothetical protein J6590_037882 [Homalodisca vitripennis]
MSSEDFQVAKIRKFLLETEEDGDINEDENAQSDHDETDHVSESDYNTDTEADNTDEDPDFDPQTKRRDEDSGFNSDIVLMSDNEELPVPIANEYSENMDLDEVENVIENHMTVERVIEEVVQGSGSIVQEFIGKDRETVWKKDPIVAATARARPANIIRRLPGPNNADETETPFPPSRPPARGRRFGLLRFPVHLSGSDRNRYLLRNIPRDSCIRDSFKPYSFLFPVFQNG